MLIASSASASESFSTNQDPWGDSSLLEQVGVALGPVFYEGEFGDQFVTGAHISMRFGIPLASPLTMVGSLGGAFTVEKEGDSAALYYDASMRLNLRLLPMDFLVIPHIEAGAGFIVLEGFNLQWLAGVGCDFRIWDDGAIGLHASAEQVYFEDSWVFPVLVNFIHYF